MHKVLKLREGPFKNEKNIINESFPADDRSVTVVEKRFLKGSHEEIGIGRTNFGSH